MTDGFRLRLNISDLDRQRLDQKAAYDNPTPTRIMDVNSKNRYLVKPRTCGLACKCDAEVVSVQWARSDKQVAHVLNQRMDRIYSRIGDNNIECAGKHIGWATAALSMGRDWTSGQDYKRPWDRDYEGRGSHYFPDWEEFLKVHSRYAPQSVEEVYGDRLTVLTRTNGTQYAFLSWHNQIWKAKEKALSEIWAKIQATRDQIGTARFIDVMLLTRYAFIYAPYLEDEQRGRYS